MLSISKIHAGSAGSASKYFTGYYTGKDGELIKDNHGEPPGRWLGGAAERLGIAGQQVTREGLERVFDGCNPTTGEQLAKFNPEKHAPGWDCTFSAPKSVSTAWALASPELRVAIEVAHERNLDRAALYLQHEAVHARRGHAGKDHIQAEILAAVFPHSTSRNNDPALHGHLVLANTALGADGQWSGIDLDTRHKMAAGAIYRVGFAADLQKLGFQIQDGKAGTFEVAGMPAALLDLWSSRRAEIDAELAEAGKHGAQASEAAALKTRGGKESPDRARNFEVWKAQAAEHGIDSRHVELARAPGAELVQRAAPKTDVELIQSALRNGVAFRPEKLREEALKDAQGRTGSAEAMARAERIRSGLIVMERFNPKTRQIETYYTTQAMLEREKQMRANAQRIATTPHGISADAVQQAAASKSLSPDQKQMLEAATSGKGLVLVQGHAGAGKSYAMDAVRDAHERDGYKLIGCAVAGKAAKGLQESSGIKSDTIASTLIELDAGRLEFDRKTVLVMDESGMTGTRDMSRLFAHAADAGAKVILVGDTKQLPPIEAGAPFLDMQADHGATELTEVRRQKNEIDKSIANHFREGRVEGARTLMQERGQWHVAATAREAMADTARRYAADRAAGRDAIMLSGLKVDTRELNRLARAELIQAGHIDASRSVVVEKHDKTLLELAPGDKVLFMKNDRKLGVKNGQVADVVATDEKSITLRSDGRDITLPTAAASREQVPALHAKAEAAEASLLKRSREIEGLTGAERKAVAQELKVLSAEARAAKAELALHVAARGVAADLQHGHAMTVYKSQGVTVKQIEKELERTGGNSYLFARDSHMTNLQSTYVAMSRNEGQAHLCMSAGDEAKIIKQAGTEARIESLKDYTLRQPLNTPEPARAAGSQQEKSMINEDRRGMTREQEINQERAQARTANGEGAAALDRADAQHRAQVVSGEQAAVSKREAAQEHGHGL